MGSCAARLSARVYCSLLVCVCGCDWTTTCAGVWMPAESMARSRMSASVPMVAAGATDIEENKRAPRVLRNRARRPTAHADIQAQHNEHETHMTSRGDLCHVHLGQPDRSLPWGTQSSVPE